MCHAGPSKIGRPSLSQLAASCRIAATDAPIGSCWRHHEGGIYEIVGYSIDKKTGELEVVYRPIPIEKERCDGHIVQRVDSVYLDGLNFHQPVDEFHEMVPSEPDPATLVHRFTRVRRAEVFL